MMDTPLRRAVETHKALGHPVRLRILAMLSAGELCACQITAVIRLAPSTISAHLSDLRNAGLVIEHKEGRFISYRHAEDPETRRMLDAVLRRVAQDRQIDADRRLVRSVRRVPVADLCRAGLNLARVGIRAPAALRPRHAPEGG